MMNLVKAAALSFLVLTVASCDSESNPKEVTKDAPVEATSPVRKLNFSVAKEDSSGGSLRLDVVLDRRVGKDTLIEIARQQRVDRDYARKLVVFYHIGFLPETGAYASCVYLPKCEDCKTDDDQDGVGIRFMMIGISATDARDLQKLTFDSIPEKKLAGSFIGDDCQCRLDFYDTPKSSLMVQLFKGGRPYS